MSSLMTTRLAFGLAVALSTLLPALLSPPEARARCLSAVERADQSGQLDRAIDIGRAAIADPACERTWPALRLVLGHLLHRRGRATGAAADHCAALDLYGTLTTTATGSVRRDAAAGELTARVECRVGRALDDGRPLDAIELLETFARQHDGADNEAAVALVDGIPDRIARLEAAHLGGVEIPCPTVGDVTIDGRVSVDHVGEAPCPAAWSRLVAGSTHRARFVSPLGNSPFEFTVRAGRASTAHVPPPHAGWSRGDVDTPPPVAERSWLWPTLTGVGAIAAVGGALWLRSDLVELVEHPDIRTDDALRADYESTALGYYTLIGVGGALAITTAVLLWPDDEPEGAARVAVGPGGLTLGGRF